MGSLKPTFAEGFDVASEGVEIWRAITRDGGQAILHRLIRYIPDRAVHSELRRLAGQPK